MAIDGFLRHLLLMRYVQRSQPFFNDENLRILLRQNTLKDTGTIHNADEVGIDAEDGNGSGAVQNLPGALSRHASASLIVIENVKEIAVRRHPQWRTDDHGRHSARYCTTHRCHQRKGLIGSKNKALVITGSDAVDDGDLRFHIVFAHGGVPVDEGGLVLDRFFGAHVGRFPAQASFRLGDDGNGLGGPTIASANATECDAHRQSSDPGLAPRDSHGMTPGGFTFSATMESITDCIYGLEVFGQAPGPSVCGGADPSRHPRKRGLSVLRFACNAIQPAKQPPATQQ